MLVEPHRAVGARHAGLPHVAREARWSRRAFVKDEADLRRKTKVAARWLEDARDGLDLGDIERRLGT